MTYFLQQTNPGIPSHTGSFRLTLLHLCRVKMGYVPETSDTPTGIFVLSLRPARDGEIHSASFPHFPPTRPDNRWGLTRENLSRELRDKEGVVGRSFPGSGVFVDSNVCETTRGGRRSEGRREPQAGQN